MHKALLKWLRGVSADVSKLLLLGLCVVGVYVLVLFYLQSLWEIFANTPMGNIFATQVSPEFVDDLNLIFDLDPFRLAGNTVLNCLMITVVMGILLKITGLFRLIYLDRGVSNWIIWVMIGVAVSTELLPVIRGADTYRVNLALFLLPVTTLLSGGFRLSSRLVPEFTVVFQLRDFLKERMAIIKIRDLPCDQPDI